jgi:hypothetical protein
MEIRSMLWTIALLLNLVGQVPQVHGQPAAKDPQRSHQAQLGLSLKVINLARVPRHTLDRAERETAALFHRFGVEVIWSYLEEDATNAALPAAGPGWPVYYLRILHNQGYFAGSGIDKHAMGFAFSGRNLIHVFYECVKAEAKAGDLPEHLVFGIVVAHELGHTLLPSGCHSPRGLMRARLMRNDWREALCGKLTFSDAEKTRVCESLILAETRCQP